MKNLATLTAALIGIGALTVSAAAAQVLTTGGTAGSSINAGANIGAGNHTGASINSDNPEAAQIRLKTSPQGQTIAKENTIGQDAKVSTEPAMTGTTGSTNGVAAHATTRVQKVDTGSATLRDVLPRGSASYTYYPDAQVYFAPNTKTYYYSHQGRWFSSATLPAGVNLTNSQSVQLSGNATVK